MVLNVARFLVPLWRTAASASSRSTACMLDCRNKRVLSIRFQGWHTRMRGRSDNVVRTAEFLCSQPLRRSRDSSRVHVRSLRPHDATGARCPNGCRTPTQLNAYRLVFGLTLAGGFAGSVACGHGSLGPRRPDRPPPVSSAIHVSPKDLAKLERIASVLAPGRVRLVSPIGLETWSPISVDRVDGSGLVGLAVVARYADAHSTSLRVALVSRAFAGVLRMHAGR